MCQAPHNRPRWHVATVPRVLRVTEYHTRTEEHPVTDYPDADTVKAQRAATISANVLAWYGATTRLASVLGAATDEEFAHVLRIERGFVEGKFPVGSVQGGEVVTQYHVDVCRDVIALLTSIRTKAIHNAERRNN